MGLPTCLPGLCAPIVSWDLKGDLRVWMEEKTSNPFPTWNSWFLTFILVAWRVLTLLRAMDGAVWKGFGTDG